jgi:hypothetical protein
MPENFWKSGFTKTKTPKGYHTDFGLKTRFIKPRDTKELSEKYLLYSNARKLANDIQLAKGERVFAIIDGTFCFGDFIEALIVERAFHVKKMTISTLSLNQNNVDSLANLLINKYVDELNLIVSGYFFAHERKGLIPYIYQELDIENRFQLAVADTHCKLCIFETHSGGFVVIHGSANLRSSSNIEQIMIEENEPLYRFNDEIQGKILRHYKTIKKPLRYTETWKTIKGE